MISFGNDELIEARVYGDSRKPTLIYLPGLHGDWTLVSSFRAELGDDVRFVEFAYPRLPAWTLEDYAQAVASKLKESSIQTAWLLGESFGSQVA